MTASRGPIPKRTAERRRRNKPTTAVTTPELPEGLDIDPDSLEGKIARGLPIPPVDPNWHPLAQSFYASLEHSQQSVYMEPSDWIVAQILCESLSRDLGDQVVGVTPMGDVIKDEIPLKGASLAAYLKGFAALGATEGDRRRMSMELKPRVGDGRKAPVRNIAAARAGRIGAV